MVVKDPAMKTQSELVFASGCASEKLMRLRIPH